MYNIEISPRYVADMNATTNYISNVLCNSDAALKLKNKADITIDDIAKNPYIYRSYISGSSLKNEYRKAKVNNYYIFFRIDEERMVVQIARFLFSKMDFTNINEIL